MLLGRRRRARRTALARLGRAAKTATGDARRFYDEAAGALAGYLADRFGLPEIDQTGDSLEKRLAERSIDPVTIQEITALVAECDFGRFVAASAETGKMKAIETRIRALVDRLERV